jgi:hypothetical protein
MSNWKMHEARTSQFPLLNKFFKKEGSTEASKLLKDMGLIIEVTTYQAGG